MKLVRLAQLWRTTTVRLTALFILIFVVFSVLLLALITWQSSIQIQQQQTDAIDREVDALQRIDSTTGLSRHRLSPCSRLSAQPGPGIYYLGRSDRADAGRQRRPTCRPKCWRAGHLQLQL